MAAPNRVAGGSLVAPAEDAPQLVFAVEDAGVLEFAAVPTLSFQLRIESVGGEPIRSLSLNTQIRIAATRRRYDAAAQARLSELFGEPARWAQTLRSLLWTHTALVVPGFAGSTLVEMRVPCTYDFDVIAAKYLNALADGDVPLEFLFSGTIFYAADDGALRIARIPWDREAEYRMPVRVWKETMDHYFPGSAWLRLRKETFDRLYAYKAARALPTWEAALDALLDRGGEPPR